MLGRMKARRGEEGFTLIELLIVIVILGILAAVVVFAVGGITNRGTTSACKSDYKTIETAQETYKANNSTYASNVGALITASLIKSTPSTSSYQITTDSSGNIVITKPGATPTATTSNDPAGCP